MEQDASFFKAVAVVDNKTGIGIEQLRFTAVETPAGNKADASNGRTYGKLYNWYAVADRRGLCPEGWRVPSVRDWAILEDYLGGRNIAGGKLKATGTQYWRSPNTGATNESGFSALPGGGRSFFNGTFGTFFNLGSNGYWWSSSESSASDAWRRSLFHDLATVSRYSYSKRDGFSVRCVGDLTL